MRRGIGGEFVKLLSQYLNLSPSIIIIFASIFSWLALAILIKRLAKDVLPSYFILSPVFLGMPIYSDFIVRKDVLGLLLLALALLVIKKYQAAPKYILVNGLIILGLLNHESILFYGLPLVLMTDINRSKGLSFYRVILTYVPSFLVVLLVVSYKGDVGTANSIAGFWNSYLASNFPDLCCLNEHPAAIDAIGWSTSQGVALSLGLLTDFANRFIYVPVIWLVTIFACMQLGNWVMNEHHKRRFVELFMVQLLFASPLFILGWDLGRWIFYISTSSLIWVSIFRENNIIPGYFSRVFDFLHLKPNLTSKELGFIGLFFGVPACCWSIQNAIISSPIGDNLYAIYLLFT